MIPFRFVLCSSLFLTLSIRIEHGWTELSVDNHASHSDTRKCQLNRAAETCKKVLRGQMFKEISRLTLLADESLGLLLKLLRRENKCVRLTAKLAALLDYCG